jgi:sporulation protein YlmC with PRC-barrel domain
MIQTAFLTNHTLNKKPVVSLADGEKLGHVDDLLIDPATLEFSAVVIKGERGESILPRGSIHSFGEDAITVQSVSETQAGPNATPGLRPFSEFKGHKVVDSAGTLVGHLHDIEIDPKTGWISSLEVHCGGVLGIGASTIKVNPEMICSFGPDLITVKTGAAKAVTKQ